MFEDTFITIVAAIFISIMSLLALWLYIFLPVSMAKKRGRSALGWVLLFWIISPLWGVILLLILGNKKRRTVKNIAK